MIVPHGMGLAGEVVLVEGVVAPEVLLVEQHLRQVVPVIALPARGQRGRGGGHEQPQLEGGLHLDAGDALLGQEERDVLLEAAAQVGGQAMVVVVALLEDPPPLVRERAPAARGRARVPRAVRTRHSTAPTPRPSAPPSAPPAGPAHGRRRGTAPASTASGRHRAREPGIAAHGRQRRVSSRPSTPASMFAPVITTAAGRPSSRRSAPGAQGGHAHRARAFRHHLVVRHQRDDRVFDLRLRHVHDLVHEVPVRVDHERRSRRPGRRRGWARPRSRGGAGPARGSRGGRARPRAARPRCARRAAAP